MAATRRHGEYEAAPLQPGRRRRRYWLRTAQLNAVGWGALLGLCLVAAAVGVAAAWALAVPSWWGAVLALLPIAAVVLLDRRRWAAMQTGFGWGGSVAEVADIASQLASQGVTAQVHPEPPTGGWHEPACGPDGPEGPQPGSEGLTTASLSYRNRDAKAVAAILRANGLPSPRIW